MSSAGSSLNKKKTHKNKILKNKNIITGMYVYITGHSMVLTVVNVQMNVENNSTNITKQLFGYLHRDGEVVSEKRLVFPDFLDLHLQLLALQARLLLDLVHLFHQLGSYCC